MHVIYLGSVSDKEEISCLSGASVAGNKMQWNIVTQLQKQNDVKLDAFSLLSVATFPRDKRIFVRKKKKAISEGVFVTQVPFINLPIIKQWSQKMSLFFQARKVATDSSIVLSYNLYVQEGGALVLLKKKRKLKTVALLADLPIDDNYQRSGVSKIIYDIFFSISKKNISECDNLIVLNKQAIEEFAPRANHIIVEGGVALDEIVDLQGANVNKKNIVYTGALTEYSGVVQLMEAMGKVPSEVVLEIYGEGPLREQVRECAEKSNNIFYYGKMPNEQIRIVQQQAWLLVNPRPIEDPIARVTFPSKIFEYMLSGRPVMSTRQYGFSEDYTQHMFLVDGNGSKEIAEKICEISSQSDAELTKKGMMAREFIIKYKNWEVQADKIYRFLKNIEKE